ncbi:MAG: DUF6477 family protein [Paracoccaceae bacterium]
MNDILTLVDGMQRPRLLVRAARIGAESYRREQHLPRLLGYGALPRSGAALMTLIDMEGALDADRREDRAGYSPARHVEVLIALMAEARLLRASRAADSPS